MSERVFSKAGPEAGAGNLVGDRSTGFDRAALRVLIAATAAMALSQPTVVMSTFSIFVLPLEQSFGWRRGEVSLTYTITAVLIALLSPMAGKMMDRLGVRPVLLCSVAALGLALAAAASMTSWIGHLYIAYAIIGVAGIGATPLAFARVIVQWFDQRPGLALGVCMSGIGLGQLVLLPLVGLVTAAYGWRSAYLMLGGVVILLLLPMCWAFIVEPVSPAAARARAAARGQRGLRWQEVLGQPLFKRMAFGFLLLGFYSSGTMTQIAPMLAANSISSNVIAVALAVSGACLFAGRIITGAFLDRFSTRIVVCSCLALPVVGIGLLLQDGGAIAAIVAIGLISFCLGGEIDMIAFLVRKYFNMANYGVIYGWMYAALLIGMSAGPLLTGYGYQMTGSYDTPLTLLFFISLLAIAPFTFLPSDRRRTR